MHVTILLKPTRVSFLISYAELWPWYVVVFHIPFLKKILEIADISYWWKNINYTEWTLDVENIFIILYSEVYENICA